MARRLDLLAPRRAAAVVPRLLAKAMGGSRKTRRVAPTLRLALAQEVEGVAGGRKVMASV